MKNFLTLFAVILVLICMPVCAYSFYANHLPNYLMDYIEFWFGYCSGVNWVNVNPMEDLVHNRGMVTGPHGLTGSNVPGPVEEESR